MKIRKNVSVSPTMIERAESIMRARGFDDFSECMSALIREEYERRHLGQQPHEIKESPTPYKVNPDDKADIRGKVRDIVKRRVRRAAPVQSPKGGA